MVDWKNWKTGAKIGFIYGVIFAIYWIPILITHYSPPVPSTTFGSLQIHAYNIHSYAFSDTYVAYQILGTIIFLPILIITSLFFDPFNPHIPLNNLIIIDSAIYVVVGLALGAAICYVWGSLEKIEKKIVSLFNNWNSWKTGAVVIFCIVIIALICSVVGMQGNAFSGMYLSEQNSGENGGLNGEYIIFDNNNFIFNEGNFTHVNYNNTPTFVRIGTFRANNSVLTMYYKGGETTEYYISGTELIPVNENSSLPTDIPMEKRFERKILPVKM